MTLKIENGDCIELMKNLPDKSIDLFICDLPYGETNCKWDNKIDMEEFWAEFKRIRKSKKVACIHFCSTKFGYELIKSWEKGFKMDMVWKKRNKTGGLQSRHRPMRNHEMVYFFYEQAPKYNRDKYHKRIQEKKEHNKKADIVYGNTSKMGPINNFEPPNPASVVEEKPKRKSIKDRKGMNEPKDLYPKENRKADTFDPPNPASVVEQKCELKQYDGVCGFKYGKKEVGAIYDPPNPASVVEEDEPMSMYESTKVFIGKRNHQTEKPQDILEFFLKYWSDEGDVILDPTMGSGSTGVACKKMKRNFVGIELTDKYYEVAQKRICPPQN